MLLEIAKRYQLLTSDCEGANPVITKFEDKDILVNHLKAWVVVGNKFTPVANLKKVKCASYGR
jgi:hypothetical protein